MTKSPIKKVYYVGSDRPLAQLLARLFAERGYTFELGETLAAGASLEAALIIIDRRLVNWVTLAYHFATLRLIPVWIVVDLPQSLGAEDNLAREIRIAGAKTYLRRLYEPGVMAEDLDVALNVTFPPASVEALDQKWVQERLI